MTNQTQISDLQNIQQSLKAPKKHYNEFGKFKYRKFEDILEELKPLLCSFGCTLVLSDEVKEMAGQLVLTATARFVDSHGAITEVHAHAGIEAKKGMDMAQTFGVSSSYARKYALNGLFLIDDSNDPDTNEHRRELEHAQQGNQNQQQQSTRNHGQQGNQRQGQQNNQGQKQQQNTQCSAKGDLKTRFNQALKTIPLVEDINVLNGALKTFQNSDFYPTILKTCKARAHQLGYDFTG